MTAASQRALVASIARRVVAGRGWRRWRLILLFAVPALLIGVGSFTVAALTLTPQQEAVHYMGAAQGVLLPVDARSSDLNDLIAKGGAGVRSYRYDVTQGRTIVIDSLQEDVRVWTADWRQAVPRSQWHLAAGQWPGSTDQVALTSATAALADYHVGDTVRIYGLAPHLTIAGIVDDPTDRTSIALLATPSLQSQLDQTTTNTDVQELAGYLLSGSTPDVASIVSAATHSGAAAYTRGQVLQIQQRSLFRTQALTIVTPGILLIVVLSAAAFIVRIRRAGRQMSTLMALGVRPSTLVAAGRLAAAGAALVGAVLGTAGAALVNFLIGPSLSRVSHHDTVTSPLSAANFLLAVVVIVAAATTAAWLPARAAKRGVARFDGSPPTRSLWRWPGLLAGAVFAASLIAAVTVTTHPLALTLLAVATVAACVAVPYLLRLPARSASGPVLVQVSVRQLARDLKRPIAATAVGIIAMCAAAGCLTYYDSLRALDRAADTGATHAGQAAVPLRRVEPTPALITALRTAAGPGGHVGQLTVVSPSATPPATNRLALPVYNATNVDGVLAGTVDSVATPEDFQAITGRLPSARESAALASGGALRLNGPGGAFVLQADPEAAAASANGSVPIETTTSSDGSQSVTLGGDSPATPSGPPVPFDAEASDPVTDLAHTSANFLVGPSFLARHRVHGVTIYLYAWPAHGIDSGLGIRVKRVAEDNGIAASEVIFDTGALSPLPLDWRLVLVAAVVLLWLGIGLSVLAMNEDARPFFQSLYALGLASRRQRTILAIQAALIAATAVVIGSLLGIAAGVVSVHALGATASVATTGWQIPLIALGGVFGAGAIGFAARGQRRIDELST